MALSAPTQLCDQHSAVKPRGVYLSGPAKTYAIFTSDMVGGRHFIAFEHGGAALSEVVLPVDPEPIGDFDVIAVTTDAALVVYEVGRQVKYFVYDFVAEALTTPVTVLDTGRDPSAANDGTLRLTYVQENALKLVSGIGGDPGDLLNSPAYNLMKNDLYEKVAYTLYYLGSQAPDVGVALPIRADVNSVFVHDCRDTPTVSIDDQSSGLVGYFKMDDNDPDAIVDEASGLGVADGTLTGANTEDIQVPAVVGGGLNLNGSSQYITVPDHRLLTPPHISLAVWVNVVAHQAFANVFSRAHHGTWTQPWVSYGIRTDRHSSQGYPIFHIGVDGDYHEVYSEAQALTTGVPHLIIGTYDGEVMRLYVDNTLRAENYTPSGPIDYGDSQPLLIGRSQNIEYYRGVVDEARIYNHAIGQGIRDAIWAAGAGAAAPGPYTLGRIVYADKAGNDLDLIVHEGAQDSDRGLVFKRGPNVQINVWTPPVLLLTLESLFIPQLRESRSYLLDGPIFVYYDQRGRVHWGYDDGADTHHFHQRRLDGVVPGRRNHLAITHTWGVAGSTKMLLNGIELPCEWKGTAGTPGGVDPGFGPIDSTVALGQEDVLIQLSVSEVSKSVADLQDYVLGRL